MAVALRGNLRDFGISEVFQLIGQQRKTGVLEVDGDTDERVHVAFLEGAVTWAMPAGPHDDAALGDMLVRVGLLTSDQLADVEKRLEGSPRSLREVAREVADVPVPEIDVIDDLVTRETVFRLLRRTEGSFDFHSRPVKPRRPDAPQLPAEQILMDGLRMVDEWRTFEPSATQETTVFQRCGRFEEFRAVRSGQTGAQLARAERIFLLIDGRTPVRRVVDLARTGSFEGMRVLSDLRRAGVIEAIAVAESLSVSRRRAAAVAAASRGGLRALLVAGLPFALLLGVTAAAWLGTPVAADRALLRADALHEARLAFETRRLRNVARAWAFAHGRDPREPGELAAGGWWDGDPLAQGTDGPYHLARREGELVLLAPEY